MPSIRPISDLRNNANEISDFCLIDLYGKLAVAEQEIASGAEGEDFLTIARQMRERVHGKL